MKGFDGMWRVLLRPEHPVASLSVQAQSAALAQPKQHGPFRVLLITCL